MKLLLVYPYVPTLGPSDAIAKLEPLGLEYIATPLLCEHEVEIVDLRLSQESITEVLLRFQPDVVGITGASVHASEMVRLSRRIKDMMPDVKVVVGGRHATFMPNSLMVPTVDIIVRGEAEQIISDVIGSIYSSKGLRRVPGLLYKDGGGWHENDGWPSSGFQGISPAHYLVDKFAHHYHIFGVRARAVQMSRGCPHSCSFCDAQQFFHGRYQYRDVASLINEIASLETEFIYTADENIGIRASFLEAVVESLIEKRVNKKYWLTMSAEEILHYRELLDRWFEAGLTVVFCGFERAEDTAITSLGKSTTVSMNDEVITYIHSRNGIVVGSFIVLPTDTRDDFERLADYIESRDVDVPLIFILTPFPGTELWGQYQEVVDKDFQKYDYMHSVFPTTLPERDFYKHFYGLYRGVKLPRLVWRMLKTLGIGRWLVMLPRLGLDLRRLSGGVS